MKYYKGFPDGMKVDGRNVTLHDLERTMLSLYWDKTLSESDKEYLMDKYKEERMRYLDGVFRFNEENRRRLEEVEQLLENAVRRMDGVCAQVKERELEKHRQGDLAAKEISVHLEIWNLEDTEEVCYSDEDHDFWDVLCGEDRDFERYWGVCYRSMSLILWEEEGVGKDYVAYESIGGKMCERKIDGEHGFGEDFCTMKKNYRLAWEDVMKISRFYLTVKMVY